MSVKRWGTREQCTQQSSLWVTSSSTNQPILHGIIMGEGTLMPAASRQISNIIKSIIKIVMNAEQRSSPSLCTQGRWSQRYWRAERRFSLAMASKCWPQSCSTRTPDSVVWFGDMRNRQPAPSEHISKYIPILHGGGSNWPPLADYRTLILRGCPKWADFSWLCSFQY